MRERCAEVLAAAERGSLEHFSLNPDRLGAAADFVVDTIRERYPDLDIPFHSRWRHFVVGGVDLWAGVERRLGGADAPERARARIDLAVISVLLDAGAGPDWRYADAECGHLRRSEGLAVASLRMFEAGAFSSDPGQPLRVDAAGLETFDRVALERGFQVDAGNPLVGAAGRAALLTSLGGALRSRPDLFGADPARPGHLHDRLVARAAGGRLPAREILITLLDGLGPIWPGRIELEGTNLGDAWRHPAVRRDDVTDGLLPLHKLSQWLAYSLVEPLESAGLEVVDLDALTGLAEYRNGGLFVDTGVIAPRAPGVAACSHAVGDGLVVEWRALTVALLDRLAPLVRERLGRDDGSLPLARILEGGTWSAGRRLAAARRADGGPPIRVVSDGTVF